MKVVNFDHASATPLLPEALAAMMPFLESEYGNPQSLHTLGQKPREAVDKAREQVARLLNAGSANRIVFTATASEASNLALKGLAQALKHKGRHIVVSAIEHQSVLEPARALAKLGFELTELGVDEHGLVSPDELDKALRVETILVSIQHASNEIGTIQEIAALAKVAHEHGALFHSDGTAAVGRIPVDVQALGTDAYSFAAQSIYGPKGAAALYLRQGARPVSLVHGGIQEKGKRAGTENVPGIAAMGAAAEVAARELPEWSARMKALSDRLRQELPERLEHVVLTGHPDKRLPGHFSVCIEFVEGEAMLLFLNDQGFATASGSACTAKTLKASHVLLAIGLHVGKAQSSLVLTLGKDSTEEQVGRFIDVLPPIIERLRAMSPLYARFQKGEDPYETHDQSCHGDR
ncbi:MAG: cysteine desulfurase [candidate division WOR-3 bacterium]|nr:MAG: cysteine desulfurase [candidate division WOR-3 bacterium]